MGSAGPAEFGSGARFPLETPDVSELEIVLLFPLCVASFAPFLFALSPRLYCEGVERWEVKGRKDFSGEKAVPVQQ